MSARLNLAGSVLFMLGVAMFFCAIPFLAQTASAQQADRLSEVRDLESRLSDLESRVPRAPQGEKT